MRSPFGLSEGHLGGRRRLPGSSGSGAQLPRQFCVEGPSASTRDRKIRLLCATTARSPFPDDDLAVE
jgi:hypothetical protein